MPPCLALMFSPSPPTHTFIQIGVRGTRQLTLHEQVLESAKVRLSNKVAFVPGKSVSAS